MDISVFIFLLMLAAPALWLPLIGKKWSAIISYLIFGGLLVLGLVAGSLLLCEYPAGDSHAFGRAYLLVAAFAAAMMLLTFFVYRYRKGKNLTAQL